MTSHCFPAQTDDSVAIDGRAERVLVGPGGFLLAYGWLADDGHGPLDLELRAGGQALRPSSAALLRSRRRDVEELHGSFGYDFGYLLLARIDPPGVLGLLGLSFLAGGRRCDLAVTPGLVSDKRLLEDALAHLGHFEAHRGRELALKHWLAAGGRVLLAALHEAHVRRAAVVQQSVRFGTPRAGPTFQTVLFGAMEAALFQPLLFAAAGIAYGEWCYVCNSPEDAPELLRLAHLASRLHDLPIRVVILADNAGFGGANNAAVPLAAAEIILVNPDVHAMAEHAALTNAALEPRSFAGALRGGLLFYDDDTLMHGGMYLAQDVLGAAPVAGAEAVLLRVEHDNKGVPFRPGDWPRPRPVAAVTGALMAFERAAFEALGGFSGDYLFGHYEDADLCLRWAERGGRVELDPRLRLVHLEGQGSHTRRPHFHGASLVNRHVFDDRVRPLASARRALRTDATLLAV